jgi:hypothetical protein
MGISWLALRRKCLEVAEGTILNCTLEWSSPCPFMYYGMVKPLGFIMLGNAPGEPFRASLVRCNQRNGQGARPFHGITVWSDRFNVLGKCTKGKPVSVSLATWPT